MKLFIPTMMVICAFNNCSAEEIVTPSIKIAPPEIETEVGYFSHAIGINFNHLEQMALRGNRDALAVIVALNFDGGAAEMIDSTKPWILLRAPAEDVVEVLKIYSAEFRAQLIAEMKKEFLFRNGDKKSVHEEFDRLFGSLTINEEKQNKAEMATPNPPSD